MKQCVLSAYIGKGPVIWNHGTFWKFICRERAQSFQISKSCNMIDFAMIQQEWKINLFEDGMFISLCIYFDVSARYCHLSRVCPKHFFCIYMHYLACPKILKYNLTSHYLLSYLFIMKPLRKCIYFISSKASWLFSFVIFTR